MESGYGERAVLKQVIKEPLRDYVVDVVVLWGLETFFGLGNLVMPDVRNLLDKRNQTCHLGGFLGFRRDVYLIALSRLFRLTSLLPFLTRLVQERLVYSIYLAYVHASALPSWRK